MDFEDYSEFSEVIPSDELCYMCNSPIYEEIHYYGDDIGTEEKSFVDEIDGTYSEYVEVFEDKESANQVCEVLPSLHDGRGCHSYTPSICTHYWSHSDDESGRSYDRHKSKSNHID